MSAVVNCSAMAGSSRPTGRAVTPRVLRRKSTLRSLMAAKESAGSSASSSHPSEHSAFRFSGISSPISSTMPMMQTY